MERPPDEIHVWRRLPGALHAKQIRILPWGEGGHSKPWIPELPQSKKDNADPSAIGAEYLRLRSAGFNIEEAIEKAYA